MKFNSKSGEKIQTSNLKLTSLKRYKSKTYLRWRTKIVVPKVHVMVTPTHKTETRRQSLSKGLGCEEKTMKQRACFRRRALKLK
mmetsp:Transcript_34036/g.44970  ORF Transcript_34036/g.44970 Transcript_34036/m.44970 type:complete len:84 (+) Transcript_34036:115-366(+)